MPARVTKITYGRVSNLGNYRTERMEVEVEVDHTEPDGVRVAMMRAKALVYSGLRVAPDGELLEYLEETEGQQGGATIRREVAASGLRVGRLSPERAAEVQNDLSRHEPREDQ